MKKITLILIVLTQLAYACAGEVRTIQLAGTAKAYYVLPAKKSKNNILLIVLHGKNQTAGNAIEFWRRMVPGDDHIILAPQGTGEMNSYLDNTRKSTDSLLAFIKALKGHTSISDDKIVVAGFSMGGSFALDLALAKPELFKNIICIFGFFEARHEKKLEKIKKRRLGAQKYYLISGDKDVTFRSLTNAYHAFTSKGANVYLDIYHNLYHRYPSNFNKLYLKIEKEFFSLP